MDISHINDFAFENYENLRKKYDRRIKLEQIGLWFCALIIFLILFYFGSVPLKNGDTLFFRDFLSAFLEQSYNSFILIVPALFMTIVLGSCFLILDGITKSIRSKTNNKVFQKITLVYTKINPLLPVILSAIPIFIVSVFVIKFADLNTTRDRNLFFGALCLSLFNVNYVYKKISKKILEVYSSQPVLYARSLGLKEPLIFTNYVMRAILHDFFIVLRELLPHLTIESIVIEYAFRYDGLLRSGVGSFINNSWYYFAIFIYALILFITIFDIIFRLLESYVL